MGLPPRRQHAKTQVTTDHVTARDDAARGRPRVVHVVAGGGLTGTAFLCGPRVVRLSASRADWHRLFAAARFWLGPAGMKEVLRPTSCSVHTGSPGSGNGNLFATCCLFRVPPTQFLIRVS